MEALILLAVVGAAYCFAIVIGLIWILGNIYEKETMEEIEKIKEMYK